jgi:hypothetical protein
MNTLQRIQQLALQLLFSAWKRKTILLFVALLSTLLLFAGQLSNRKRTAGRVSARVWEKAPDPYAHLPPEDSKWSDGPDVSNVSSTLNGVALPFKRDSLDQTNLRPDTLNQESDDSIDRKKIAFDSKDAIVLKSEPEGQHFQGYIPDLRIVHLDLKGAPPKIEYFERLFPLLKDAGANGILLEYEDMFPFEGSISMIKAGNAYTKEQVIRLIQLCAKHQFELIPLVQTFGHLEFALKLKEFRKLREVDRFPAAICPSRNESFEQLIQPIIDQVVELHKQAKHPFKYLHIGCDEVFHMAQCDLCRDVERETLFISHVRKVASYVFHEHHLKPIIWDDMLRTVSEDKLPLISDLVEIMVWTYIKDIYRYTFRFSLFVLRANM